MALRFLWYSGQGPLQYDDTSTYDDMVGMEASRAPQHYIEEEPTELYHAVRLSGLTSKLTSSSTNMSTTVSTQNSKIASAVVAGGSDSIARSMATSAATV
jgi:hypothetical protein